jgi:hypothetical protein
MKKVILRTPKSNFYGRTFSDADRLVSDTPPDIADHNNYSVTINYVISNCITNSKFLVLLKSC